MAYQPKDNTGSLFKNDKATSTSHPQAKGDALIEGVAFWVSAWTNVDKKGNRYQSLKFERKEQKPHDDPRAAPRRQGYAEQSGGSAAALDDDLPFAPEFR